MDCFCFGFLSGLSQFVLVWAFVWLGGGVETGEYVVGVFLFVISFAECSNHALKFHLQSFLAGGNIPCTEDYCRGTVNFGPKVYLPFTCAVVPGFLLACAQLVPISHFI